MSNDLPVLSVDDPYYDVVVLGTGAAALTAAIKASAGGASVGLFEKADAVGGTSAWSGGMVWIPNNPHMAELGIEDSTEEALTYLLSLSQGLIDIELATALLEAGPELVSWLEANTPVQFSIIEDFPDYHSEQPGAKPHGGRSMETPLFPFSELGEWAARVSVGPQLSGNITMSETALGRGAPQGVSREVIAQRKVRDERGTGQSLVGALLKGCLDRGIEPQTGMRATSFVTDGGRVVGVRFESGSGPKQVRAGAVVLATGGFEWDPALVRSFIRGPLVRAASVPTNTGDGLRMAMRIGADLGNMREAWWVPIIDVPVAGQGTVAWQVNGERTRPHCIMVNRHGHRFTNEAANYNALGAAFHVLDVTSFEYLNHPAWMIFDDYYLSTYGLARHKTGRGPTPDWMTEGATLLELAEKIDVPADALQATVERWNEQAAAGVDSDFGRGEARNDRWWGDPAMGDTPQSTIGPLDTAPFYAVQVRSGALGTKGGPRTDANGQVIDVDGNLIGGLYAAGNVMSSVMGMTYGGAGGTLGPAMVFGYLAGQHAAAHLPARAGR
jgi:succinate dehydrogenase/fumarate reductase flavoprotein subunit